MGFFKSPAEKAVKILYKHYTKNLESYLDPNSTCFKDGSKWINEKKFYEFHSELFSTSLTFSSREIFRQKMDQINFFKMVHQEGLLRDSYEIPLISVFLSKLGISKQEFEESKKLSRY